MLVLLSSTQRTSTTRSSHAQAQCPGIHTNDPCCCPCCPGLAVNGTSSSWYRYSMFPPSSKQRVGILGGTFDPPHIGHLNIAKSALQSGLVDVVWLLPCWKHAFGKNPTPFFHRAAMCYLMVRSIPDVYVCTDEAETQSTYSVEILEFIQGRNPNKELRLLLGADNYWKMNQWQDKDRVLELAKPIWFERPGTENPDSDEQVIKLAINCSSTEIRSVIAEKGDVHGMISDNVYDYIIRERLYVGVAE